MLTKYYKLQNLFLGVGLVAIILVFFGLIPMICKVLAGICFIITIFCYYKIISTLAQVSDITTAQVWVGTLSHTATIAAIYLFDYRIIFSFLFVGSIISRSIMGIVSLDRQMKSLCAEFDENILRLAIEEQSKNARSFKE